MALTNHYFTPNHIIVNYELGNMIIILWKSYDIKLYTIFLFIFQFFILMIFLEIIELNFCHLNDNTKRNIQIRGDNDMEDKDRKDTVLEIGGYIIEIDDNNKYNNNNINNNNNFPIINENNENN